MMMVRRRARPAKEQPALMVVTSSGHVAAVDNEMAAALPFNNVSAAAAAAAAATNLLDDQYFASPKRKDCRLMKTNENLKALNNNNTAHIYNNKDNKANTSTTTKPDTGRAIGVPLATRSQTRTIENFFRANAAKKMTTILTLPTATTTTANAEQKTINDEELLEEDHEVEDDDEEEAESESYDARSTASPATSTSNTSSPAYHQQLDDLVEVEPTTNNDNINVACSFMPSTQTTDIHMHRSTLRDSHSSSHSSSSSSAATSENLFLQEPVLTLDIDRTPTKASSIRINKSFEMANNAVFSSPPSVLSACVLNGRFNQIVTLTGHVLDEPDQQQQQQPGVEMQLQQQQPLNGFELDQHDSSSCDSGVACSLTTGTSPAVSGMRRRKPATPHRILCPSPIKTMARDAGTLLKGETQSPRKSPRKLQSQLVAAVAATGGCKSRRRLNQPKPQAPYQQQQLQLQQQQQQESCLANDEIVVLEDDDDDDDVHALLKAAEERENQNKAKLMLKPNAVPAVAVKPKPKTAKARTATAAAAAAKSQPLAATNGNREMTDFFPVRRSVRKTKTAVKEEMMRNLEQAVLEERCEGLQIRHFTGKGRGVVAERRFKRNEFVVEYVGDLIAISEATDRERRYALDENAGCYMYYFKHKNQQYCIDATVDTGKLGRLINHSRNGNLMTKVVVIKQRPHLVLLAKDDIEPGEELTYDYGDRSKESLLHHPWLAF
ncbi:histone-lysine N-methyltransferase Set8 isoform X1 [Drosophila sulfurigaster albostrigata]|uniref:histone-lysine N-methyltransferase Set8 isoform X1 n=1 Tax=Drosophila sulfurigaster albostrigata TaxID=89887 RepID=UPI002D21CEE6|nr:histone-lysine N-methyltransferase Set8 isoform X1 [Drosophila sulfurigaster albostrigata]